MFFEVRIWIRIRSISPWICNSCNVNNLLLYYLLFSAIATCFLTLLKEGLLTAFLRFTKKLSCYYTPVILKGTPRRFYIGVPRNRLQLRNTVCVLTFFDPYGRTVNFIVSRLANRAYTLTALDLDLSVTPLNQP